MITQQQILGLGLECPIVRECLERWSRHECTWEQALMVMVVALSAVKRDLLRQHVGGVSHARREGKTVQMDNVRAGWDAIDWLDVPDPPQCPPIPEPPRYPFT